jgi:hypothetical protein
MVRLPSRAIRGSSAGRILTHLSRNGKPSASSEAVRPRDIPSVDTVLSSDAAAALTERYPRALVAEAIRQALAELRREILTEAGDGSDSSAQKDSAASTRRPAKWRPQPRASAARWLAAASTARPAAVVNATGAVLHEPGTRRLRRRRSALAEAARTPCAVGSISKPASVARAMI